jgi:GDP-L-fucose synthase
MKCYDSSEILNVGVGYDVTIAELAELVADCVGYKGSIEFDSSKPDGTPRKLLDAGRLDNLGWRASIALSDGIRSTYAWFLQHVDSGNSQLAVH